MASNSLRSNMEAIILDYLYSSYSDLSANYLYIKRIILEILIDILPKLSYNYFNNNIIFLDKLITLSLDAAYGNY
jgi:hypothetical protein